MSNKELSAWAAALVTLLKRGLNEDAIKILESVIIPSAEKDAENEDQKKGQQ